MDHRDAEGDKKRVEVLLVFSIVLCDCHWLLEDKMEISIDRGYVFPAKHVGEGADLSCAEG